MNSISFNNILSVSVSVCYFKCHISGVKPLQQFSEYKINNKYHRKDEAAVIYAYESHINQHNFTPEMTNKLITNKQEINKLYKHIFNVFPSELARSSMCDMFIVGWYLHGELHRRDGPAIILYETMKNRVRHQAHPQFVSPDKKAHKSFVCLEIWISHGKIHRNEGGPAVVISACVEEFLPPDLNNYLGIQLNIKKRYYDMEIWYDKGIIHNNNGPAIIYGGDKYWIYQGMLHRENGPAITKNLSSCEIDEIDICIINLNLDLDMPCDDLYMIVYYNDGKCHRDDGPAINLTGDNNCIDLSIWMKHGKIHRDHDPAYIIWYKKNNLKKCGVYFKNSVIHRDDGPAIIIWDNKLESAISRTSIWITNNVFKYYKRRYIDMYEGSHDEDAKRIDINTISCDTVLIPNIFEKIIFK